MFHHVNIVGIITTIVVLSLMAVMTGIFITIANNAMRRLLFWLALVGSMVVNAFLVFVKIVSGSSFSEYFSVMVACNTVLAFLLVLTKGTFYVTSAIHVRRRYRQAN